MKNFVLGLVLGVGIAYCGFVAANHNYNMLQSKSQGMIDMMAKVCPSFVDIVVQPQQVPEKPVGKK